MALTWIDYQLMATTIIFILLGIGHNYFGRKAYVKGSTMDVFTKNGNWIPDSAKELTLLGVFYMIAFSWWQSLIILLIAVITENSLGFWVVSLSITFELPQRHSGFNSKRLWDQYGLALVAAVVYPEMIN